MEGSAHDVPESRKKQLEWSRLSARDLLKIDERLVREDPDTAFAVVLHVREQALLLEHHPNLGRVGSGAGRRELVLSRYPFTIHYRVTMSKVKIVRVLHQARKYP